MILEACQEAGRQRTFRGVRLDKAFSQFDAASASKASSSIMKPVGLKGTPLESLEKIARGRRKEKISELMSAYRAFTKGKLTPYQEATLTQRKVEAGDRGTRLFKFNVLTNR